MQTTITKLVIYVALILVPPPISFGLPPCSGSTTGLTERYEPSNQTLYVDECLDGEILEENLPIIDMTSSVAVVMTSRGRVTVQLPQLDYAPIHASPAIVQIHDAAAGENRQTQGAEIQADLELAIDCDKVKLFLDDCVMGGQR